MWDFFLSNYLLATSVWLTFTTFYLNKFKLMSLIMFLRSGTTERACLITGSVDGIMVVLDFIMEKIKEKPELVKPFPEGVDAKMPQDRDKQVCCTNKFIYIFNITIKNSWMLFVWRISALCSFLCLNDLNEMIHSSSKSK